MNFLLYLLLLFPLIVGFVLSVKKKKIKKVNHNNFYCIQTSNVNQ